MNSPSAIPFYDARFALTLGLLLLAPLAIAGVALINTGLGRSRSAAQSLLGVLVVVSIAVIAFALVGSAFAAGTAPAPVPPTSFTSPENHGIGQAPAPCV